jgi:hypothetical protein
MYPFCASRGAGGDYARSPRRTAAPFTAGLYGGLASVWAGIPALWREWINAPLVDPKMKARLADLGGTVLPLSPTDFGKLIADESEKWCKVIRTANIRAELRLRFHQRRATCLPLGNGHCVAPEGSCMIM